MSFPLLAVVISVVRHKHPIVPVIVLRRPDLLGCQHLVHTLPVPQPVPLERFGIMVSVPEFPEFYNCFNALNTQDPAFYACLAEDTDWQCQPIVETSTIGAERRSRRMFLAYSRSCGEALSRNRYRQPSFLTATSICEMISADSLACIGNSELSQCSGYST